MRTIKNDYEQQRTMLKQILQDMFIDPELLAELDEEQKHLLFLKMREEQIRRWKEREEKLSEKEKLNPFIPTKPARIAKCKLKVSFLTDSDDKPWTWVIGEGKEEDRLKCLDNRKNLINHDVQSKKPAIPEKKIVSTVKERKELTNELNSLNKPSHETNDVKSIEEASAVETAWIEQEKVCKRHDEARRTLAKRVRELSRSESVASLSEVPPDPSKTTETSPKTTPIVGKQMPFVFFNYRNLGVNSSPKPDSRKAVINWFQQVEQPRGAAIDPSTGNIAEWFHGIISREESEELLQSRRVSSFLIRVSEKIWGYTISYKGETKCKHFLVDSNENGYHFFGANVVVHKTLSDFVKYHEKNPLSMGGNEFLLYPCGQSKDAPDYSDLILSESEVSRL